MTRRVEPDQDDRPAPEAASPQARRTQGPERGTTDPLGSAAGPVVDRTARRPVGELSYGEASAELDGIVALFERGEVDIDGLVEQLERATAIVEELDRRLTRTRARVDELVPRLAAAAAADVDETDAIGDG
jgi:exodeoxyribonuclease VII small subunit